MGSAFKDIFSIGSDILAAVTGQPEIALAVNAATTADSLLDPEKKSAPAATPKPLTTQTGAPTVKTGSPLGNNGPPGAIAISGATAPDVYPWTTGQGGS